MTHKLTVKNIYISKSNKEPQQTEITLELEIDGELYTSALLVDGGFYHYETVTAYTDWLELLLNNLRKDKVISETSIMEQNVPEEEIK